MSQSLLLLLLLVGDFVADPEAHNTEPLMLAPIESLVQAPLVSQTPAVHAKLLGTAVCT